MSRICKCVVCGKEFETDAGNAKYCSDMCRGYTLPFAFRKPHKKKFCVVCGEEIDPLTKNYRYCSAECRIIGEKQVRQIHESHIRERLREYNREYRRRKRAEERELLSKK